MQRAKTRRAIALPARVANDDTFGGLPRFDFHPGVAALAGKIKARALLGDDAFEAELPDRFEKSRAILHRFAQPIGGIAPHGIVQPLTAPNQRLVHDRATIQIKTVEEITDRRMFGLGALDATGGLLLHAVDHV